MSDDLLSVAKNADRADLVTANFDLRNISPREVDQMARELKRHDLISDQEMFLLLTQGAEHMSSQPGNVHKPETLETRGNLLGKLEQQVAEEKAADNPVEAHKNVLEFIRKLEARNHLPFSGIVV